MDTPPKTAPLPLRACAALIALALASGARLSSPLRAAAIGRAEIEADWVRQFELRDRAASAGASVRPEEDAAGGCDGRKDGTWGFHTEDEERPWWQVDLGEVRELDRLVLYNRCDACAERTARTIVLLSEDGASFRQVYQHDGTTFFGHAGGDPLTVRLGGARARYVRLQLPGKSYFHLDEVEAYAPGGAANLALGRPATQSSVSQWSARHGASAGGDWERAAAKAIERGLRLAESLRALGAEVRSDVETLRGLAARLGASASGRELYLEARRAVRALAFKNPLLDFDAILFAKAAPGRFPHISDQFYGWWSRPGGGIYVLEGFRGREPELRCLTADMPEGSFLRPELSWDGKKVLFAYCRFYPHVPDLPDKAKKSNLPEDAFYHIFEIDLDGTNRRQLTRGRYDDFDARVLPSGEIVFLSTRKGRSVQTTRSGAEATAAEDLPDSYVRCGGDDYRPVPVFTLHAMDADGGRLRPLSAFENFEWSPCVANDGRILYTRWDYIDRFNGHFFSLWAARPDGSNPELVYGNYTVRPQALLEARPIPGSTRLLCVASAHHSITGGSIVRLDRGRGTEGEAPIDRLTPDVPFPETEGWPTNYYASPYPLSEEHFLVAWSDRPLPPHCRVDASDANPSNASGIYLADAFGNLELLYRDPEISSTGPVPVRPRPRPHAFPSAVAPEGPEEGRFLLLDVYRGLEGVPRGSVKALRVVGVPPKTQPHMNQPNLGVSSEDPGKFLLGTAPVEEDGSAHFRVPSGIPVFFQALGEDGLAVQTMRSLTYVWPGETLSCAGCHEPRESAPPAGRLRPIAAGREPSRLRPGPPGSWPLRFDELVQPVLDRACVSCHRPGGAEERAAPLDLTPARSYESLLDYAGKDLRGLAFERDRSLPGDCVARRSKLFAFLANGGPGARCAQGEARLGGGDLERIAVWMDLYAQRLGHFSAEEEEELRDLRRRLAPLLEE